MSSLVPEVEGLRTGTGRGGKKKKKKTNYRCKIHVTSRAVSGIRSPTFLSRPQRLQGYTGFNLNTVWVGQHGPGQIRADKC